MDYSVKVDYWNKETNTIEQKEYPFDQYASMVSADIMRALSDVEYMILQTQHGRPKELWDDPIKVSFDRVRHRMLDSANAVRRLPKTFQKDGEPCSCRR